MTRATTPSTDAYAELPQADTWLHFLPQYGEAKMLDFADRTHALRIQAAPKAAPGEHYDEVRATLTGLHTLCENISAIERRVGPLGSHARGYTHKITAALRHLDALYTAAPKAAQGELNAYPMAGNEDVSALGPWQSGTDKPSMDGTYLREFDEGEGTSEFHLGAWLRDGFFPSDLQDVRWRGRAAPHQEAQERVYLVNTGEIRNGHEMYERHEKPVPLADCEVLYTEPQPAPARLTKPAKVGNGTFCAGVHERRVIEAAQRQYEIFTTEPEASNEERMAQERARRNLWDMLHGPLPTSSNDPALPTRPQVADTLLAEVAGNFTRDDDLPNDLLGRIDAYLTSEGYTE